MGQYEASMVLAGVGDAMGYKCGDWEFCFDGEKIHAEAKALGGVKNLRIRKPSFIVRASLDILDYLLIS